jgi:hypothetical protein
MTQEGKKETKDNAIGFFEKVLRNHKSVSEFRRDGPVYFIELESGDVLTIFLVCEPDELDENISYYCYRVEEELPFHINPYTVSEDDITEIVEFVEWEGPNNIENIDCIVTLSSYNKFTTSAHDLARVYEIELLDAREFVEYYL